MSYLDTDLRPNAPSVPRHHLQTLRHLSMRLLNARTRCLESFYDQKPPYAILSHTWDYSEERREVLFRDIDLDHPIVPLQPPYSRGAAKVANACEVTLASGLGVLMDRHLLHQSRRPDRAQ